MPKISVIVPVYNVEKYLHKCVDSILAQTFLDLELILVDDGSPDNCGAICDEYAENDNRIKVIHQENGGLSAARNAGLDWTFKNSNSDWIAFVDSDDYLKKEYLEKLFTAANNNNADVAICGFLNVNENGDIIGNEEKFENEVLSRDKAFELLLNKWYTAVAWNKLYTKQIFTELRYPAGKLHEDEFVIHKIFDKCEKITTIEDQVYCYLQRDGSITHKKTPINKLDLFEALTGRCDYCRKNGFAYDDELLGMMYSDFYDEKINRQYQYQFNIIREKYRQYVFSCGSNRTIKKWFWFNFCSEFNRLYAIRNNKH